MKPHTRCFPPKKEPALGLSTTSCIRSAALSANRVRKEEVKEEVKEEGKNHLFLSRTGLAAALGYPRGALGSPGGLSCCLPPPKPHVDTLIHREI